MVFEGLNIITVVLLKGEYRSNDIEAALTSVTVLEREEIGIVSIG